jgi:HD superfamily phosphodiesterase
MINYKQILEDKIIIDEYKKIDAQNKYPFNHGLQHIKNVCEIMNKLCDALDIIGIEKDSLLIACALHDIGQVNGRENHGIKAKEYAVDYLKNSIDNLDYYNKILNAIADHDKKQELDKLPMFTNLVCFADKMDFSKKRLEKDYEKTFGHIVYEDVEDVDFEYNNTKFILKIKTNGIADAQMLLMERNFFHKVINATIAIAKKMEVDYKIMIDEKALNLEDTLEVMKQYHKK